ncbi:NAD(P)-binding protein, partial [Atractiella rhizophila]
MVFQPRPTDNNIKARLALVTGASGGLGQAISKTLAKDGLDIALHYSSSKEKAEVLQRELASQYPNQSFTIHAADLASAESTATLVPSVLEAHKREAIDVLVNNAGLGMRLRNIEEISLEQFELIHRVNTTSVFQITKEVVPLMKKKSWGRIVMISSISAHGGGLNGCHYASTKGAMTSMGLNLSTVLAPWNITVNIVSPAMVVSGMIPQPLPIPASESTTAPAESTLVGVDSGNPALSGNAIDIAIRNKEDIGRAIASTMPLGRLGEPEEVADAVGFFVRNGFVTGVDLK